MTHPARRARTHNALVIRRVAALPGIVRAEIPDMALDVAARVAAPAGILRIELQQDFRALRFGPA